MEQFKQRMGITSMLPVLGRPDTPGTQALGYAAMQIIGM
jgi:hypothetical protein